MSRSDYTDYIDDNWEHIRWRGAVKSASRGKRGQHFLKRILKGLKSLKNKELIVEELVDNEGNCCAMGAVCINEGLDVSHINPEDYEKVAEFFDVSPALVREIAFENDDGTYSDITCADRYLRMKIVIERMLKQ